LQQASAQMATTGEDESKKRKAEDSVDEPAAKKEAKEETEKEGDAAADGRAALKSAIGFNAIDTTLNVFSAMDSKVLMALTEGGMQYLLAGARANVAAKAGRYMYEVKIIESLNPSEAAQGQHGRSPQPRQTVRVGFSTAGSPLLLGDSEDCVYFDSEGWFGAGKQKRKCSQTFTREQVVAVLLNLDPSSPNANTVSLFRDGVRVSEPQALPEKLHGKALFPHVTYRNVSLQVNMGPAQLKPLPFKCRMIQTAAAADTLAAKDPSTGGKCEVIMPVALPDEGTFDWLDGFLEQNPSFVELSDRKLQDWAAASGLQRSPGVQHASNDKPSFAYGLRGMDDMSLQRVVKSIAPMVPRNYVIMEVKSNLIKDERAEVLRRFNLPSFKKTAMVVMGQPANDFKKRVQDRILNQKQIKIDAEWKAKKAEKERHRQIAQKQKELRKKAEEQKKKMEADAAKKEGEAKDEKMEDTKEEIKEEEVKEEPEDDGLGDAPPQAELTEEEGKVMFRPKLGAGDLAAPALARSLGLFTLPEKSEGYDEVKYAWEPAAKSQEYLKKWLLEAKRTTLLEHLQPSKQFTEKILSWQKQFLEWQQKQQAFKAKPPPKKDEQAEEAKAKLDIFGVEDVNNIGDGEPLYASFGPEDWALAQLRYELHLLQDAYRKDVQDVDRAQIPEGHLSYYYNKYFKKQLNPGAFHLKSNTELVSTFLKDTVSISGEPASLVSMLSPDMEVDDADIFVKFAEESRRERKRRQDAGDETTTLKYTPPTVHVAATSTTTTTTTAKPTVQPTWSQPRQSGGGGGWKGGGGWNRW